MITGSGLSVLYVNIATVTVEYDAMACCLHSHCNVREGCLPIMSLSMA